MHEKDLYDHVILEPIHLFVTPRHRPNHFGTRAWRQHLHPEKSALLIRRQAGLRFCLIIDHQ